MEDTQVYLIRLVAPTLRSKPSELQNLHRNSAAGLLQKKNHTRHYIMAGMTLSNASPITLQTSGANVTECVFM